MLAVPLLALLITVGVVSLGGPGRGAPVSRSLEMGAINAVVFTVTPVYFW